MPVENEELNETELFNQSVSDESAEATEPAATEAEQPERPEGEVVAETKADGEKPTVDDNAPLVPSWRLREVNEEKRGLADRLAALEAERLQWQANQQRQPEKEPEKAKPDPLLDPEGYAKHMEERFNERLLGERREMSLRLAKRQYKEEFDEAYSAARANVDPVLKARMQNSDDPGETLIQWHRETKTMKEVGTDPKAWLEKQIAERLKDPTFLAKAVEAAQSSARETPQQTNGRPRVELPPSLNSASRSNAALRSENQDVSDPELFREITG